MSVLRTVLFDWDVNRVSRITAVGLALYISQDIADEFLTELVVVIILCGTLNIVLNIVLNRLWSLVVRISDRLKAE
ncbi:hypothetical protein GCM10009066_21010 [Halarchaeum salinum]|uniref:DUF2061 domain-containing protein n=1 Tax=Halarchaeum salinum TaxID=489912 RepID=A0AAV3SAJ8_9EURY